MLDIERIVKAHAETTELKQSPELLSIESWGVHVSKAGLLQVEPDKSLWIIVKRNCPENHPHYPYQATVHLHGIRWFAIGTKEEFDAVG